MVSFLYCWEWHIRNMAGWETLIQNHIGTSIHINISLTFFQLKVRSYKKTTERVKIDENTGSPTIRCSGRKIIRKAPEKYNLKSVTMLMLDDSCML